jgi:hypothetical protein
MKALLLIGWLVVTAAVLWWPTHKHGFDARWVSLPPSIALETYEAARKASGRPSFCMYHDIGTACRVS